MSAFYTVLLLLISFLLMSFSNEISKPEAQPQRLPNDDSDFKIMRMKNFVYVDKTPYLIALLNTGVRLCFVTRPRRFGKTLFIDMMDYFFGGQHCHAFENLSVYYYGNSELYREALKFANLNSTVEPWVEYPVIRFNFNLIKYFKTIEQFEEAYIDLLNDNFAKYGCKTEKRSDLSYARLLTCLYYEKFKKVPMIVLVDEYDHPFQYAKESLKNEKLAEEIREFMNQFLNQIKGSIQKIGLAFVSGVTKMPLDALQSGPNNFIDFTHRPELAHAFGLTQHEIRTQLKEHVLKFGKTIGENIWDIIFNKLVNWYDGYRFVLKADKTLKERVLNPVSTITSLKTGKFSSHWSATGSMNYVLKAFYNEATVYKRHMFDKNYRISSRELFERYDPIKDSVPLPIWMFRCGYLTIADYHELDNGTFVDLKYPNFEIRTAITDELEMYVPFNDTSFHYDQLENYRLNSAFQTGNFLKIIGILRKFGFHPFFHPSNENVTAVEVTRRLQTIFKFASLHPMHGVKFPKDQNSNEEGGDIDFLIAVNGSAYVITTKCHGKNPDDRAYSAMKQLIGYTKNHPVNFWKYVHQKSRVPETSAIYFLALGFGYNQGGKLTDWAAVSYVNKSPVVNSIEVDNNSSFGEKLRDQIKTLLPPVKK